MFVSFSKLIRWKRKEVSRNINIQHFIQHNKWTQTQMFVFQIKKDDLFSSRLGKKRLSLWKRPTERVRLYDSLVTWYIFLYGQPFFFQLGNLERKWQHIEQNNFAMKECIFSNRKFFSILSSSIANYFTVWLNLMLFYFCLFIQAIN